MSATVAYDDATRVATLTPLQRLDGGSTFTATVRASIQAADGAALAGDTTWSFTSAACPCSLFSTVSQPAQQNLGTQDGRTGAGPWTYELG